MEYLEVGGKDLDTRDTAMAEWSDVLSGGRVVQDFIIEGSDTSTRSIRVELVLVTRVGSVTLW